VRKEPAPPFRMDTGEIRDSLRRIEILSPLGEEDLDALIPHVGLHVYGRGETVVRQGEEGNSLFIVLRGSLEVCYDGKKVGELSGGEFFGEMSLLTGEKRRATVVAAEEVRLIEVSKEVLSPVISSHPSILTGLSAFLERRLEQNAAARRAGAEAVEPPPLQDAILQKLMRFFGIS
jgi:CRP-like cAMP-binding protein